MVFACVFEPMHAWEGDVREAQWVFETLREQLG